MIPPDPTMPPDDEGQESLDAPPMANVIPLPGNPLLEDRVPLDALATADESQQLTTPAVGDRVTYSTDGKIIRLEGQLAVIQKESVNGQSLADESQPAAPAPDSIDQLTADASQMDQNQYD